MPNGATMHRIRFILWDVGGTLVKNESRVTDSIRERLHAAGIPYSHLTDAAIEATYAALYAEEDRWRTPEEEEAGTRNWYRRLLGTTPATEAQLSQIPSYFHWYRPVDGIEDLLSDLRERGIRLGIVSNWPPSLPRFLEYQHLAHFFDAVVYSGQDGILKPDPRIFDRALRALGGTPPETLMIGDRPDLDILPARAAGMRAVCFDPRHRSAVRDAETVPELRGVLRERFGLSLS